MPQQDNSKLHDVVTQQSITTDHHHSIVNLFRSLQKAQPSRERALAITKLQEAAMWLEQDECNLAQQQAELLNA